MMFIKYGLTDTKRLNVLFHYFDSYQQAICWDNLRDPKASILALRHFFGQMSTEIMRTFQLQLNIFSKEKDFSIFSSAEFYSLPSCSFSQNIYMLHFHFTI